MTVRLLLSCALLAASSLAAQDDYNAIFDKAVDAVEFEFDKTWAYTESQVNSEGTWVGRFDPRRPSGERWQLLSVDGRDPTEKQLEEYQKDKMHDHSDDDDNSINAMVEPDSVRLIDDAADYWLFGFIPDDEEIMESVDATIRIDKDSGQLEYIDLRNHETIRPAIGVKISKLITRLSFGPAVEGGPIVPLEIQVEVKGRAYLVVSFDEQEILRNSDFVYVGGE